MTKKNGSAPEPFLTYLTGALNKWGSLLWLSAASWFVLLLFSGMHASGSYVDVVNYVFYSFFDDFNGWLGYPPEYIESTWSAKDQILRTTSGPVLPLAEKFSALLEFTLRWGSYVTAFLFLVFFLRLILAILAPTCSDFVNKERSVDDVSASGWWQIMLAIPTLLLASLFINGAGVYVGLAGTTLALFSLYYFCTGVFAVLFPQLEFWGRIWVFPLIGILAIFVATSLVVPASLYRDAKKDAVMADYIFCENFRSIENRYLSVLMEYKTKFRGFGYGERPEKVILAERYFSDHYLKRSGGINCESIETRILSR